MNMQLILIHAWNINLKRLSMNARMTSRAAAFVAAGLLGLDRGR